MVEIGIISVCGNTMCYLNHISHLATVEIRVVQLGSFQNLYLSFAIVEITHGITANRDDKKRCVIATQMPRYRNRSYDSTLF